MYSPESKRECHMVALKFSLHIKVPYGESLPSVIFTLHQPGEFSVFTFVLFNSTRKEKKKGIPLLLMFIALSTAAE